MPKFERLNVWTKSLELSVYVYRLSSNGKLSKDFGLRDQMRRAEASIPANIAEGDEMESVKQSIKFFRIAKGSSGVLYTHAEITKQIDLLSKSEVDFIQNECVVIWTTGVGRGACPDS